MNGPWREWASDATTIGVVQAILTTSSMAIREAFLDTFLPALRELASDVLACRLLRHLLRLDNSDGYTLN